MQTIASALKGKKITWVVHTFDSGGIGPVCSYTAKAMAQKFGCESNLLSLHDEGTASTNDSDIFVKRTSLALKQDNCSYFLEWLRANPQDFLITNDVRSLDPLFVHIPKEMTHVAQLHDSGKQYLLAAKRNLRYLDGIICVAHNVKTALTQLLGREIKETPVCTVQNGAEFPMFSRPAYNGNAIRLLYIGRLDPLIKGTFDLVAILKSVRSQGVDYSLTIVGGICQSLNARFHSQGLAEKVFWTGRVSHPECYRLASEHDIFLMTSRKEPFGMVTIEAMSMGCVPIAHDILSGSQEIIEDGQNGFLIKLGDINQWGRTIAKLTRSKETLNNLCKSATQRARGSFSIDQTALGLHDFLIKFKDNTRSRVFEPETGMSKAPPPLPAEKASRVSSAFKGKMREFLAKSPRLSVWYLRHFG